MLRSGPSNQSFVDRAAFYGLKCGSADKVECAKIAPKVVSGRIVITPDGGTSVIVRAGDAFVVEANFKVTWKIEEPVRKHFDFKL
jgi:hypothetical protein